MPDRNHVHRPCRPPRIAVHPYADVPRLHVMCGHTFRAHRIPLASPSPAIGTSHDHDKLDAALCIATTLAMHSATHGCFGLPSGVAVRVLKLVGASSRQPRPLGGGASICAELAASGTPL